MLKKQVNNKLYDVPVEYTAIAHIKIWANDKKHAATRTKILLDENKIQLESTEDSEITNYSVIKSAIEED